VDDQEKEVEIVCFFEFDNKRKMMSVIIKDAGVYKLYCKGADSSILGCLSREKPQPVLKPAEEKISEFSKQGLRTLCMAFRVLTESEVQTIRSKLLDLNVLLENRDQAMGRL
jgi:magnesium-transporting ATPase (P-type)